MHTKNPFNGKDEVYGEVVCGLGATLVGNTPGRALSFSGKDGDDVVVGHSFPSKSFAMYTFNQTKISHSIVRFAFGPVLAS
mgnify:CR=1 FL=1